MRLQGHNGLPGTMHGAHLRQACETPSTSAPTALWALPSSTAASRLPVCRHPVLSQHSVECLVEV